MERKEKNKDKIITENQNSMTVLTFALVLVTSFLSAEAILGKQQPLIIFLFGVSLFAFATGIILMNTNYKKDCKTYIIFIFGVIGTFGTLLYYTLK